MEDEEEVSHKCYKLDKRVLYMYSIQKASQGQESG
jgi:hypothetical protein